MLFQDRIKNLMTAYPRLSRVWIKTDNPRLPLKSVWIDESALHRAASETGTAAEETAEFAEDHLLRVA